MNKTMKRLLVASGIAAVGAAATILYRKVGNYLVDFALNREEPKQIRRSKNRLSDSEEFSQIVKAITEASESLRNREHETVEILSKDGVRLVGHWREAPNAKRVIVAMHGWRSSWSRDFGSISQFWEDSGCSVLYAEQRGQGSSGGDYMGFGLLERYDCLEWIRWAIEKTGGTLPIYLGGMSMGATTVLMTAGFELPDNVHGVMADCGFTSPHAIWKHVTESNFHIPYGLYGAVANELYRKKLQVAADDYSCSEAMRNCKVPVIFVHGTADHFVPVSMTYENYQDCAAPKYLFVVPGAEHGLSYLVDKAGYEAAVKAFWAEYD